MHHVPGSYVGLRQSREQLQLSQATQNLVFDSISLNVRQVAMKVLDAYRQHPDLRSLPEKLPAPNITEVTVTARFAAWILEQRARRGELSVLSNSPQETEGEMFEEMYDKLWDWFAREYTPGRKDGYIPDGNAPSVAENELLQQYRTSLLRTANMSDMDEYDTIRNGTIVAVGRSNVDEFLGKIEKAYERDYLDEKTVELLANNRPDDIRKFRKKTREGVFVFGFNESVRGRPTIGEQMRADVTAERDPKTHPTYQIRCLIDHNRELLSWFSYWQPPIVSSKEHRSMVHEYLDRGVMGAKMLYADESAFGRLLGKLDRILLIDTLQGVKKRASARLFAHEIQSMLERNPQLEDLIGYRLLSINMQPKIFKQRYVHYANNRSSEDFFNNRDSTMFATDKNKSGPKSHRTLSDGTDVTLNPIWTAFSGDFTEIYKKSLQIWRSIQHRFGDVSDDGLREIGEDHHGRS